MPLQLPAVPPSLKPVQHLLKVAGEHETRDPVITYWARVTALQAGLKLDKSSKDALGLLLPLMDWLEKEKAARAENEAVTSEVVAAAHVENYGMKLFTTADTQDRAGVFNKNVVKCFYTAGIVFDIMETFGELQPETAHFRKYAKMKAAYIHNCLKAGETPIAGPLVGEEGGEEGEQPEQPPAQPWQPPSQHPGTSAPVPYQPPAPSPYQPPAPAAYQAPPAAVQPAAPAPALAALSLTTPGATPTLSPEQITRAQKLCKFAISALDYQDSASAVENLTKALNLVRTGQEQ